MHAVLLLLLSFTVGGGYARECTPSLWIPKDFDTDTLTANDWEKYKNCNKGYSNKDDKVYKSGSGISYKLKITSEKQLQIQLNWNNKAYPGGDIYYGIYPSDKIKSTRDKMCKNIRPLPTGSILDDSGPFDTATMSYFLMITGSTSGRTYFTSDHIKCNSNKIDMYLLVSYLDYTNPNSRVLGRYFASEDPDICSSKLCKESDSFFKWLIFGVRCDC
jgi:hypothetical protein